MSVFFLCFYVLFVMCVNGPLWTDFQINGMEWNIRVSNSQAQTLLVPSAVENKSYNKL